LDPGAQVIILQAVATYAALLSAYFFARPVLRGQTLQAHRELLADMKANAPDIAKLIAEASTVLSERNHREKPVARRDNAIGVVLLVGSLLLYTAAIGLQVLTDPQFNPKP
jgi:type II secretory pathway component PulM